MKFINRKYIMASRPLGKVGFENFSLVEEEISSPPPHKVLVKNRYISVDPYMRNRMNAVKSYVEPYEPGALFGGDATAEVIESNSAHFSPGDLVTGPTGWQEYAIMGERRIEKIDLSLGQESAWLGILGLTGLTAYFGMMEIGKPLAGESLVVSGAAGAVGSVAGQIGRILGCRVAGITGSDSKAGFLVNELGFDHAINYRAFPNVRKPLMKIFPDGVDIFFDNVGGEVSDSVFFLLRDFSRIVLCGQISMYNEGRMATGPRLHSLLLIHRSLMKGFIVYDYQDRFPEARKELSGWMGRGLIRAPETVKEGFTVLPGAFLGLFEGINTGKLLVKCF